MMTAPELIGFAFITSLGLRKHEHDSRSLGSLDLPFYFLRILGTCQPIAGFVIGRFAIYDNDVAMRVIALNVIHSDVPGFRCVIVGEGNFVPIAESADDFDCRRLGRLAGWHRPAEDFTEAEPRLVSFRLELQRRFGRKANRWRRRFRSGPAFDEVCNRVEHN